MGKLPLILLSILLFFVVFPKNAVVFADEGTQSAAATPTAMPDYILPYPGLLPDNPLYTLKVLRDRIISFFISDPLKKSSFDLLQSDKRLEASWYLLKKGEKEESLTLSTLSKSTNYLQESFDQAKQARESGADINDVVGKLQDALGKHVSVVAAMKKTPGVSVSSFEKEEQRLTDLQKAVSDFSKQQ